MFSYESQLKLTGWLKQQEIILSSMWSPEVGDPMLVRQDAPEGSLPALQVAAFLWPSMTQTEKRALSSLIQELNPSWKGLLFYVHDFPKVLALNTHPRLQCIDCRGTQAFSQEQIIF